MTRLRAFPSAALAFAVVLSAATALADRVADVHSRGTASPEDRAKIEKASDEALHALGHTTASPKEVAEGEAAAGNQVDRSAGLVAIGKVTGSDWVVDAVVTSTPRGLHVDVEACQVSTGRVETASRDLDPNQPLVGQLREMLALLLRPQGIADDPIPWLNAPPPKTPPPTPPKPIPTPGVVSPPPPPPPEYGRPGAVYVGVGGGAYGIAARLDHASPGRVEGAWAVDFGYSLPSQRRVELTGMIGGFFGPATAIRVEVGGRYMLPLTQLVAVGAAADLGFLAATSSSNLVRLVIGASPVVAFALNHTFQVDVDVPSIRWAPGSSGSLLFVGGEASLIARF